MTTEITVRGSAGSSVPPERGTVHASISYEGPSMEPVYTRVARDLEVVQASVAELKNGDDAAVTWWSAERLRTWSSRPWNQDGEQRPLVHHASVNVKVKFRDFAMLSTWVSQHVTSTEGFHVTNIDWALTVKRRDELIREVRERAVRDAVERAQQYANALGVAAITSVAIADSGMLVSDRHSAGVPGELSSMARSESGHRGRGPGMEFAPQDIEVSAAVDARFVAQAPASDTLSFPKGGEEPKASVAEIVSGSDPESTVGEFRDDDLGYTQWLAAHPDGYVVNILRSYSPSAARLHQASCWTLHGQLGKGVELTNQYVKVCAAQVAELDQWVIGQGGEPIQRCGTCRPTTAAAYEDSAAQTEQMAPTSMPQVRKEISGPNARSSVVEAWADDYIRFDNVPVWQQHLRDEIRSRCQQLVPTVDQVLHAEFFGAKHPKADVENVLLYNIDSFKVAGANGIRFEHSSGVPLAHDGAEYSYGYRYALAPRTGVFAHWQQGRVLASFDWTDLGAFGVEKQLAQVWLALSRGQIDVRVRAVPDAPFALKVEVRPPQGRTPVWGGLVKGIFDGVICGLQAHTDTAVLPVVAARLATVLPADAVEIEERLVDQRRSVLGAVNRLVAPYRGGVKWDPCDQLCVAGQLIAAEAVDDCWAIKGEVLEVSR